MGSGSLRGPLLTLSAWCDKSAGNLPHIRHQTLHDAVAPRLTCWGGNFADTAGHVQVLAQEVQQPHTPVLMLVLVPFI